MSENNSDFNTMEGFMKESICISLWKSDTNLTDKVGEVAFQVDEIPWAKRWEAKKCK